MPTKVNWFQVALAVLRVGAVLYALHDGKPLVALLLSCYVVADALMAVI